jgi:hypothetical protein
LVKPSGQVRDVATLYELPWKSMNKAESALLRNLGWTQQTWDTKFEAAARWPTTMQTRFAKLSATQRESVRQLGLSQDDWDASVQDPDAEADANPDRGGQQSHRRTVNPVGGR